jgi:riboflavin biosynthesis pyrimidine reductase
MVEIIASLDEFGHFSDSLERRWTAGNKERTNSHVWRAHSDAIGEARGCNHRGVDPIRIGTLIQQREK